MECWPLGNLSSNGSRMWRFRFARDPYRHLAMSESSRLPHWPAHFLQWITDYGSRKRLLTYTEIITDELWCVLGIEMGMEEIGYGGLGIGDPRGGSDGTRIVQIAWPCRSIWLFVHFRRGQQHLLCVCKYGTYVNINFIKQTWLQDLGATSGFWAIGVLRLLVLAHRRRRHDNDLCLLFIFGFSIHNICVSVLVFYFLFLFLALTEVDSCQHSRIPCVGTI